MWIPRDPKRVLKSRYYFLEMSYWVGITFYSQPVDYIGKKRLIWYLIIPLNFYKNYDKSIKDLEKLLKKQRKSSKSGLAATSIKGRAGKLVRYQPPTLYHFISQYTPCFYCLWSIFPGERWDLFYQLAVHFYTRLRVSGIKKYKVTYYFKNKPPERHELKEAGGPTYFRN